jgi:hypothetical protein
LPSSAWRAWSAASSDADGAPSNQWSVSNAAQDLRSVATGLVVDGAISRTKSSLAVRNWSCSAPADAGSVVEPATTRARSPSISTESQDPTATLDDLREAVTTLEEIEPTARRVLGTAHPITSAIDYSLQNARAALRARETQPPSEPATTTAAVPDSAPSLADVVSQFGKAVSDGKFRAAVPDPEPDEGAVNPWLADQISKLAVSRDHRA